ncbi:hypothetical protein [Microbacterium sp. SLBN-146]|uniref:hypothetical protein n=1 Tax=Microbacterium sp. SLBN-146 TaxID=2768457 RepID=UPI00114F9883|nr:hypothetical protein [Microbacterium sp. SLBN-146]TQJ31487.1 hypothetical protein FBY39_1964 [Microbacterium sp. SLBN-146]
MRGKNRIGYGIGIVGVGVAIALGAPALWARESWLGWVVALGILTIIGGAALVVAGLTVWSRDRRALVASPAREPRTDTAPTTQWNREYTAPGVLTFTNTGLPTELRFIKPWSSHSTVDTDFSLPIKVGSGDAITVRYEARERDRITLHWRTPPSGEFQKHSFRVEATTAP